MTDDRSSRLKCLKCLLAVRKKLCLALLVSVACIGSRVCVCVVYAYVRFVSPYLLTRQNARTFFYVLGRYFWVSIIGTVSAENKIMKRSGMVRLFHSVVFPAKSQVVGDNLKIGEF